jgi:hypothetical protein
MIKQLFFTAALLAPSLAYAGNPSADLTIQIVPPPPPNPGVPAPAAAAGFTTPVIRADFTVPGNFWSNTANYITNCGAAASVPGQPATWHFTTFGVSNNQLAPCSRTSIVTDPVYGGQVLNEQMQPNDLSGDSMSLGFPVANKSGGGHTWLPNNYYIRIVARCDAGCVYYTGTVQGHMAFWARTTNYGESTWVDQDDFETGWNGNQPLYLSQTDEWYNGGANRNFATYTKTPNGTPDITQYLTIEALYTSDGSTKTAQCIWVNGTLAASPCSTGSFQFPASYGRISRDWESSLSWYPPGAPCCLPINANFYIKSLEIWSCANVGVSTCPGTIVDHWPFP